MVGVEPRRTQSGVRKTCPRMAMRSPVRKLSTKPVAAIFFAFSTSLAPSMSGDIVSGTVAIEETNSLDYSHHGEGNAYRCHALGIDAAHEIGVGEVVHTRR